MLPELISGVLVFLGFIIGMLIFLTIVKNASIVRHPFSQAPHFFWLFCSNKLKWRTDWLNCHKLTSMAFSWFRMDVLIRMCGACHTDLTTRPVHQIAWIYHKPENWNLLGWVPLFVRRYIMHSFCKVCVYGCSKHFEGKGAFFESSAILLPHPGFRQPCASLKFPAHSMVFINVVGTPGTTMWRWWWGWGAPRSPCSGSWSYLPHWGTPISFLVSRRPITKGLCSRVNVRGWLCCVIWTLVGLLLHYSCFHFQADWVWLRLNLQHPVCVEECPRQEGASQTRS